MTKFFSLPGGGEQLELSLSSRRRGVWAIVLIALASLLAILFFALSRCDGEITIHVGHSAADAGAER